MLARLSLYNRTGYNWLAVYELEFHIRSNSSCPYNEYVTSVFQSGAKQEAAKIRATVERLKQCGSAALVKISRAEKMNDVWQLRVRAHRIFYFWHGAASRYVILNAFRKQTRKTPFGELQKAETLRFEYLRGGGK